MAEKFYVVVGPDGEPVSYGTQVADERALKEQGLEAVEVDGPPSPTRVWDKGARKLRDATEAELDALDPVRVRVRERKEKIAAARKGTQAQKLDAILDLLEGLV